MNVTNTAAASLSDEQRTTIRHAAEKLRTVWANHTGDKESRELCHKLEAILATPSTQAEADFKNFHRLLCERFDYAHDERDWKRDQLSLIEHIASRAAIAAGGAQEAVGNDWKDIRVKNFDALMAALDRAESKGYLPDAMSEEWTAFEFYAAPLPRVAATVPFQQRVQPWMLACFGAEIAADRIERNHRFFEEATELVQACGMTASEAHQLVDYTFGRPVGEPSQEVGGVMVTLAALCLANRLDMHDAGETELARINVPETVAKIRAKQAAKPKHSPLPIAAPASASNGEQ